MNMHTGLTPLQARVQFHQERILRSTGSGSSAHAPYIESCKAHGIPALIGEMTPAHCKQALFLLEVAASKFKGFRDIRTNWQSIEV